MTQEYEQKALIRAYNSWFGRCFKFTHNNKTAADYALTIMGKAGCNRTELVDYWRWKKTSGRFYHDFIKDCYAVSSSELQKFKEERPDRQPQAQQATDPVVTQTTEEEIVMSKEATDGIVALGQVLSGIVQNLGMDGIRDAVAQQLKDDTAKWIQDTYGPIEKKTTVVINGKKSELKGVVHEKFDSVLNCVANGIPVFLTGPAGSGKNVLCKQIADCLGLKFYFSNAVSQEYKILGFTDANGVYQETQFYKAFKNGGLFMLDEMDASNPDVLNILNAAIANGYQDFPAPIGYVEAHPNFRVVGAGNTYGTGADYDYVGRTQLDAATLNRFIPVRIDYDPRIEEAVTLGKTELLRFCRQFREACKAAGIRTIVSYRNMGYMAQLDGALSTKELVESCLVKGLEKGDLQMIKNSLSGYGEYSKAFAELC